MPLISAVFQQCACVLWLFRRGRRGGHERRRLHPSSSLSSILIFAGSGVVCRGTAGCCQLWKWPRAPGALVYSSSARTCTGRDGTLGCSCSSTSTFCRSCSQSMAPRGAPRRRRGSSCSAGRRSKGCNSACRSSSTSLPIPATRLPPRTRSVSLTAARRADPGLTASIGTLPRSTSTWDCRRSSARHFRLRPPHRRWTLAYGERASEPDNVYEAKTMLPRARDRVVVTTLHGFLEPEPEMHRPTTGSTPLQWVAIHLIHPFNTLALLCGLVAAPRVSSPAPCIAALPTARRNVVRHLPPALRRLPRLRLRVGQDVVRRDREAQTSVDAPILNALDYLAVCALTTALAYPVTRFVEPKVAAWLKSRFAAASPELL